MPQQHLNFGSGVNTRTGDTLDAAMLKVEANFTTLFTSGGGGSSDGGVIAVPYSLTPAFDASLGTRFYMVLTGEVESSTLVNVTAGQRFTFIIKQDAIGGHTFVWPANVRGAMLVSDAPGGVSSQDFCADIFTPPNIYATAPGVTGME